MCTRREISSANEISRLNVWRHLVDPIGSGRIGARLSFCSDDISGSPSFTFTFSRRFYPKRLTMNTFVIRSETIYRRPYSKDVHRTKCKCFILLNLWPPKGMGYICLDPQCPPCTTPLVCSPAHPAYHQHTGTNRPEALSPSAWDRPNYSCDIMLEHVLSVLEGGRVGAEQTGGGGTYTKHH